MAFNALGRAFGLAFEAADILCRMPRFLYLEESNICNLRSIFVIGRQQTRHRVAAQPNIPLKNLVPKINLYSSLWLLSAILTTDESISQV